MVYINSAGIICLVYYRNKGNISNISLKYFSEYFKEKYQMGYALLLVVIFIDFFERDDPWVCVCISIRDVKMQARIEIATALWPREP